MADTALQLLDSAQRNGAAFAENVQRTLDAAFRAQEEVRQFDKRLAVQQSQFAAEMSYKDASLAETKRVNDMNAMRYSFLDELAAKKYETEAQLEPLRLEASKIGLEAAKINKERALQENRDKVFNSITSPFDTQAASLLAGSRSTDFGNSYLALKSKYQSDVARGLPFDEAGFRSEYDELANQYVGITPTKEYDPALATLLDKMGATNEANRMRAENPTFSGSIRGLKAGALSGGRQAFSETMGKYGSFLGSDDELDAFAVNADAYFGLSESIAGKRRELEIIQRSIGYAKTPEQKQQIQNEIDSLQNEISEASKQKSALYQRAIGIQTATTTPEDEMPDKERRARANLGLAESQTPSAQAVTPDAPMLADKDYELKNKRSNINAFKEQFPEALGGSSPFNFREWQGHPKDLRISESHIKLLRNHVLRNLNSIPTDDREAAEMGSSFSGLGVEEGETKTLESLILRSPQFAKIFENLKDKAVKVPSLGEGRGFSSAYIGDRSITQYLKSAFGSDVPIEIDSIEDVRDLLRNYDGPAESKRMFMEKLYASVVAAGAIDAFSLPE